MHYFQLTRSLVLVLFILAIAMPAYAAGRYDGIVELTPIFNKAARGIAKADPPPVPKLEYKPPQFPSDTSGIKLPSGETLSSTKEIKALLPPPMPNVPKGPTP